MYFNESEKDKTINYKNKGYIDVSLQHTATIDQGKCHKFSFKQRNVIIFQILKQNHNIKFKRNNTKSCQQKETVANIRKQFMNLMNVFDVVYLICQQKNSKIYISLKKNRLLFF